MLSINLNKDIHNVVTKISFQYHRTKALATPISIAVYSDFLQRLASCTKAFRGKVLIYCDGETSNIAHVSSGHLVRAHFVALPTYEIAVGKGEVVAKWGKIMRMICHVQEYLHYLISNLSSITYCREILSI